MDDTNKPTVYDPNALDPRDDAARALDDLSDGIDWDEIIATTQPDYEAGRFAFNAEDYPTDEAAMAAMDAFVEDVIKEALREVTAPNSLDAPRA
jgi:hypothetical protein